MLLRKSLQNYIFVMLLKFIFTKNKSLLKYINKYHTGIVLIKNLLMLSPKYYYSSLDNKFQYYQNILINILSDSNLSVLWLGLILIISDRGFINSYILCFLYFPVFF